MGFQKRKKFLKGFIKIVSGLLHDAQAPVPVFFVTG